MADTATRILDAAQELIQTGGFTAMSFQQIATQVGIKKPSIVHHFPNKAALGVAVVRRYRDTFAVQLRDVQEDPGKTTWDALEFYFSPYRHFASSDDKVCLCGALAGEVPALPQEMGVEVKQFMEEHQTWLEHILRQGRKNADFRFEQTPTRLARMLFNALQGTLLVKRSTRDMSQLEDVIRVIKQMLK